MTQQLYAAAHGYGADRKLKGARLELSRMRVLDSAIDFVAASVHDPVYQGIMAEVRRIVGVRRRA